MTDSAGPAPSPPAVWTQTAVPASWALASMTCIQLGAALSHPMLLSVGPAAVTWLRLCWAAVILVAFARPWPALAALLAGRAWSAVALGAASGGMTLCYFSSLALIPQGMSNGIEFLGPLAVGALGGRRWLDAVAVGLAALGVALLLHPTASWHGDPLGIAYAAAAGLGWAAYILLTRRVGQRFAGLDGLAISMTVAALVTAPMGLPAVWGHVSARDVLAAGGLAIMIPVLPYVLEMAALRRLKPGTFGILMSLEPGIATICGVFLLGQIPGLWPAIGFVCVIGASLVTLTARSD